ncbi:MAG: serine hydrolase, partial [Oscillospiraceae bacterium]|nr:serine hydrolase [Oscillospiraceae bacterium]
MGRYRGRGPIIVRLAAACVAASLAIASPTPPLGAHASASPSPLLAEVTAPAYILVEMSTGKVVLEHNADERMYPASTTKIMTAILAIENIRDFSDQVKASPTGVDPGPGGMHINIGIGEVLPVGDVLGAMIVKSANECSNILAEHIAGSIAGFVGMMNSKAESMGLRETHYMNAHGMHHPNHYTTARDLATISLYAMALPKFRELAVMTRYEMSPTNMHNTWDVLYNTNNLLYEDSDYYDHVTGVKTGYTSQARNCLVASAIDGEGVEFLCVV